MIDFVRTPDTRFKGIPNYPFDPNYTDIDGLRMHYVDEGPKESDPILMLHGEPTWSYLYRHMIPICAAAGHRVIAPDLIGFGKSDKPTNLDDYSYQSHMDWLTQFIKAMDLKNITLVCQDWGSLLGLRLAAENESRFKAIVVGNGMLPTGDEGATTEFKLWKAFALNSPWFPIGRIVDVGSGKSLSKAERKAYDAPFPSSKYKAGTRAFPRLVPVSPDNPATQANREAWKILEKWNKPFLTTFSSGDPIFRPAEKIFHEKVPGARGQKHRTLWGGHFLQEDSGTEFAQAVNELLAGLEREEVGNELAEATA